MRTPGLSGSVLDFLSPLTPARVHPGPPGPTWVYLGLAEPFGTWDNNYTLAQKGKKIGIGDRGIRTATLCMWKYEWCLRPLGHLGLDIELVNYCEYEVNYWNSEFKLLIGANFLYAMIGGSPLNHGFLHMFTIDLSQNIEPLFAILNFRRF